MMQNRGNGAISITGMLGFASTSCIILTFSLTANFFVFKDAIMNNKQKKENG
jgi:hypothetical protein